MSHFMQKSMVFIIIVSECNSLQYYKQYIMNQNKHFVQTILQIYFAHTLKKKFKVCCPIVVASHRRGSG